MELVTDGTVGTRPAPFLACSDCEHCEEVRVRLCEQCGAPKPAGQSCGCFDNNSQ
jgi:hypothetical protein